MHSKSARELVEPGNKMDILDDLHGIKVNPSSRDRKLGGHILSKLEEFNKRPIKGDTECQSDGNGVEKHAKRGAKDCVTSGACRDST